VKNKVFGILIFFLLLVVHQVHAQRPIPATGQRPANTNANPNQRQAREPVPQEEQEVEGRRTLLDDSTKMVFGPHTSLFFYEKDIKRNRLVLYPQDTLLDNFDKYDPVAKGNWKNQDLGNIGSATKSIFYKIPELIGTRSGFHGYDLYFKDPQYARYFDTKSPFTEMSAFFGGGSRNMLDLVFARNVNPRWNVGFEMHTIRARKTLNPVARDDNMATQNSYSFQTNYRSENEKYWVLATFSRMRHVVNEIGGIVPPEVDSTSLYFTYENAKVWLNKSRAIDLRQDYHVYHEYKLKDGLQVYHVFDKKKQDLGFNADLTTADSLYYPSTRFNQQDTTQNINNFGEWRNEMGFKGTFGGFYYNAFAKFRTGRMKSPFLTKDANFNEVYIGGELIGDLSDKWALSADGEYLLPGAFRLRGVFKSPWLELEYTKALHKPTSMQQNYAGNHYKWNNDFSNTGVDQIKGTVLGNFKNFQIRPVLTINRINNYIYFNQDREVAQAKGGVFMLMPSLNANFKIGKKFRWDNELIYTKITGESKDVFRIPSFYANSRFYVDSPFFDNNVVVQMGLDVRYHSSYFGEAYFTGFQQFHLQNEFEIYAYPVFDFFLNFRINRTRVLLKYNHLNSGFMRQEGFFVTPDYTGYKSFLDLGITWYLFD
jgi:hypothetical protein